MSSKSVSESKVAALQIKPFTVEVFSKESQGAGRQLYAFDSTREQKDLLFFIQNLGGIPFGDWYEVATNGALDKVTSQAKDLGGFAYNLFFR